MILAPQNFQKDKNQIAGVRLFGAAITTIGLITWVTRNLAKTEAGKKIILSVGFYHALAAFILYKNPRAFPESGETGKLVAGVHFIMFVLCLINSRK